MRRRGPGFEHMRARAAWNARHRAAGALIVFSLLGAGCSEAPPHCQDEVKAAFKRFEIAHCLSYASLTPDSCGGCDLQSKAVAAEALILQARDLQRPQNHAAPKEDE